MAQDILGVLSSRLAAWVSHMLKSLAISMRSKNKMKNRGSKSKSAEYFQKAMKKIPFNVGDKVIFNDLLGHDEEAWGMDRIDFAIMKNYLGKKGTITSMFTDPRIPYPFNTFITVQFSDGYTVYNANQFAFHPAPFKEPKVLDFIEAKKRLQAQKEKK